MVEKKVLSLKEVQELPEGTQAVANIVAKVIYVARPTQRETEKGTFDYRYAKIIDHEGTTGYIVAWDKQTKRLFFNSGDVVKIIDAVPLRGKVPTIKITSRTRIIVNPAESDDPRVPKANEIQVQTKERKRYPKIRIPRIPEVFERAKAKNKNVKAIRASIKGAIAKVYRVFLTEKDGKHYVITEFLISELAKNGGTIRAISFTEDILKYVGLDYNALEEYQTKLLAEKDKKDVRRELAKEFTPLIGKMFVFNGVVVEDKFFGYIFKVNEFVEPDGRNEFLGAVKWAERINAPKEIVEIPKGTFLLAPAKVLTVDKIDYVGKVTIAGTEEVYKVEFIDKLPEPGTIVLLGGRLIESENGKVIVNGRAKPTAFTEEDWPAIVTAMKTMAGILETNPVIEFEEEGV